MVKSTGEFWITGRGRVLTVENDPSEFTVGDIIEIDGKKWLLKGIEQHAVLNPKGPCGLLVSPVDQENQLVEETLARLDKQLYNHTHKKSPWNKNVDLQLKVLNNRIFELESEQLNEEPKDGYLFPDWVLSVAMVLFGALGIFFFCLGVYLMFQ